MRNSYSTLIFEYPNFMKAVRCGIYLSYSIVCKKTLKRPQESIIESSPLGHYVDFNFQNELLGEAVGTYWNIIDNFKIPEGAGIIAMFCLHKFQLCSAAQTENVFFIGTLPV